MPKNWEEWSCDECIRYLEDNPSKAESVYGQWKNGCTDHFYWHVCKQIVGTRELEENVELGDFYEFLFGKDSLVTKFVRDQKRVASDKDSKSKSLPRKSVSSKEKQSAKSSRKSAVTKKQQSKAIVKSKKITKDTSRRPASGKKATDKTTNNDRTAIRYSLTEAI